MAQSWPPGTCRSFFLTEESFGPVFILATVAVTFFHTWIFNHTRGSGASETRLAVLYTAGWCAVELVLVVFDRKTWRKPTRV